MLGVLQITRTERCRKSISSVFDARERSYQQNLLRKDKSLTDADRSAS